MAEKKISGRTFRTEPAKATEVLRLQARLLKVIGPATSKLPEVLGTYAGGKKDEDGNIKLSPEQEAKVQSVATSALMDVFAQVDGDEWVSLVSQVAGMAEVQAPSGTWDQVDVDAHFTGRLQDLVALVAWVLREQLGDFISGLLANGARAKQAAASQNTKSAA